MLEQELKAGLADLKSTRQTLKDAEKLALEGFYLTPKAFGRISAADYRRMMALERTFGLYQPTGRSLTASRKRSIREHWQELEKLTEDSVFAAYPERSTKKTKTRIKRDVRKAYRESGKVTKKGIFISKSDRQMKAPIGTMVYDRETGVYAVKVQRPTKSGLRATELRYIGGADVLEKKRELIRKRYEKLPPLKRNQRLRFIIGTNTSRRVWQNIDQLFAYTEHYRNDAAALATFLNELIIEVVQKGPVQYVWRGKGKRRYLAKEVWTTPVKAFRTSSMREVHPDIIRDMLTEMEEDDDE